VADRSGSDGQVAAWATMQKRRAVAAGLPQLVQSSRVTAHASGARMSAQAEAARWSVLCCEQNAGKGSVFVDAAAGERSQRFVLFERYVYSDVVSSDAEITFADHMGRFYARRYAYPPMVGRLVGYLAVCDPPEQSIGELAEALLASRSAIAGAVKVLEAAHAIRRTRAAGERMDRVGLDQSSPKARGFDLTEYQELGDLAREGLEVVEDAPVERRAVLLEMAAFADFLCEQLPVLQKDWIARRDALRAAGELPNEPHQARRGRS
jgi:hypothetical protein